MKIYSQLEKLNYEFETFVKDGERIFKQNGSDITYNFVPLGNGRFSLIKDNKSYLVHLLKNDNGYRLHVLGSQFKVKVEDERTRKLNELVKSSQSGPTQQIVKAPIPGLVISVEVNEGDRVEKGQKLLILEAMKMENIIKASCDCTVQKISIAAKDTVQQEQALLTLISE